MKKIIASALVSILLIGSLASCGGDSQIAIKYGDDMYHIAKISGFDENDAKYLIEHPLVPLPDTIEISEDMTVEIVDDELQVTGSITNVSDNDLRCIIIKFTAFTREQIRSAELIYQDELYSWALRVNIDGHGTVKAGETIEFQTITDPNILGSQKYISLKGVTAL